MHTSHRIASVFTPAGLLPWKVHFGTIYGVFGVGLVGIWAILNLMSMRGIDMLRTASVMGYCLLPIVILAALSIPIELQGLAGARDWR